MIRQFDEYGPQYPNGPAQTSDELVAVLYDELRALARSHLARQSPAHTLQPTALVHEAWLRLSQGRTAVWDSRGHFFASAARTMRQIVVDAARKRAALKRGGGRSRETLTGIPAFDVVDPTELLALDDAITNLAEHDQQLADIVVLRHFAGLNIDETAAALELSDRTIVRGWRFARAWLAAELGSGDSIADSTVGDRAPHVEGASDASA